MGVQAGFSAVAVAQVVLPPQNEDDEDEAHYEGEAATE
jgi:hypothetical protein